MKAIILNFLCALTCFIFLNYNTIQGDVPHAILSGVSTILCFISAIGIYCINELNKKENINE